jgi:cytochrome P450
MLAYVIAGHDTTANTFSWGLIYLADHPQAQATLRSHLDTVFSLAAAERRLPTVDEIIKSHAPYLDATIEEILRCSVVLPMVSRQAQVDTTILGHAIPKGTLVMCMSNGPGFFRPGFLIEESVRSKTSQTAPASALGSWDEGDMHMFKPERWLDVTNDEKTGEQTLAFNAKKGPMNSFGGGPRGCFGRRLAYMELRILTVLLLWNFKLLPIAPDLRSYRRREQITVEPADCHVRLEERPVWMDAVSQ